MIKKIIIISSVFILSGCSFIKPFIKPDIVPPDSKVMQDCSEEFKLMQDGSFSESIDLLIQERKERQICIELNKQKKAYIERILKENK